MASELVTWSNIDNYINSLVNVIKDKSFTGVYGIPRGGLIFAVILSHKLNIPLLMAPCDNCIIIDDIADTGQTLKHFKENKSYYIATMFYHKQSIVVPDFWYREKTDNWIVYPWEVQE